MEGGEPSLRGRGPGVHGQWSEGVLRGCDGVLEAEPEYVQGGNRAGEEGTSYGDHDVCVRYRGDRREREDPGSQYLVWHFHYSWFH